jgi:hypothetical protein
MPGIFSGNIARLNEKLAFDTLNIAGGISRMGFVDYR